MSLFTAGWIVWALYFGVLEFVALRQSYVAKRAGTKDFRGTLSEHLWLLFGINRAGRGVERDVGVGAKLRRVLAGAALLWFGIHIMTGGAYF